MQKVAALGVLFFIGCGVQSDEEDIAEPFAAGPIDLVESSAFIGAGGSDLTLADGVSFTGTDTVSNLGAFRASGTTTTYYLIPHYTGSVFKPVTNATGGGNIRALGTRTNAGVAASPGFSNGSASLKVPTGTPDGTYSVRVCADGPPSAIPETSEKNNCAITTESIILASPDLQEALGGAPSGPFTAGQSFTFSDIALNLGGGNAGAFVVTYYLSTNGTSNYRAIGSRTIASGIGGGGFSFNPGITLTIPSGTAPNAYFVRACADVANAVPESIETNNCISTGSSFTIDGLDLVVSDVSFPETLISTNGTISVTDTTFNQGNADAGASHTKLFFSTTQSTTITGTSWSVRPTGATDVGRFVGPLTTSAPTNSGTTTALLEYSDAGVHGITKQLVPGIYYVIACADWGKVISESSEGNNCTASTASFTVTNCGNGVLDTGEECDDANLLNGDGCDTSCTVEPGYICSGSPSVCSL